MARQHSKTHMVETIFNANRQLKCREVVAAVQQQFGVKIDPNYVSSILSHLRHATRPITGGVRLVPETSESQATTPQSTYKAMSGGEQIDVHVLMRTKVFVKEIGGITAIRKALDILDKLQAL